MDTNLSWIHGNKPRIESEFYFSVCKSLTLVPILSHMNQVHTLSSIFFQFFTFLSISPRSSNCSLSFCCFYQILLCDSLLASWFEHCNKTVFSIKVACPSDLLWIWWMYNEWMNEWWTFSVPERNILYWGL